MKKIQFSLCLTLLLPVFALANNSSLSESITVESAYIRAMGPQQTHSAAFMQITNHSAEVLHINNISSAAAEKVELHQSIEKEGRISMSPVTQPSIAANASLHLSPGGLHMMFVNLKQPLVVGQNIDMNLCFKTFCKPVSLAVVSALDAHQHQHQH